MTRRASAAAAVAVMCLLSPAADASAVKYWGSDAELSISSVSDRTVRIVLAPLDDNKAPQAGSPSAALVEMKPEVKLRRRELAGPEEVVVGSLRVRLTLDPLTIIVTGAGGKVVQELSLADDGSMTFLTPAPILGLGEGSHQFDRRGQQYPMLNGQRAPFLRTHGGTIPVPFFIGTDGWAMFVHKPWGQYDLREGRGKLIPQPTAKGREPLEVYVSALDQPADALAEYIRLTGKPVMPPKWILGYVQSHRTLYSPEEPLKIATTFREKKLPIDVLIYLGTGYTNRDGAGWNMGHGTLEFNPKSFDRPDETLKALHDLNFKVILHKNAAPRNMHGASVTEKSDSPIHISNYWARHRALHAKIDGWWPDDGDELPIEARLARHRAYYEGPLQERPNERPWSLHRNGYAGAARYGGWIWSGDPQSLWQTLASHVPVGINHGLSLTPFWSSDTGGFVATRELTGELYARWFQFSTFTSLFRSHGRNWHLRLPWGWNTGESGPIESPNTRPDAPELRNAAVEPICKTYLELRYRLLPYNYTLMREAHDSGLPPMRALWLHYPGDPEAVKLGTEYLWGRDILVAPVVEKGATSRRLYLPEGTWYDWWTGKATTGKQWIERPVDLATLPLYVRAGAIIPLDPVRQYTGEKVDEPTTVRVFTGRDGEYRWYEDDGKTLDYLQGKFAWTKLRWDDGKKSLTIEAEPRAGFEVAPRSLVVELVPGGQQKLVKYGGERVEVTFETAAAVLAKPQAAGEARPVSITVHADKPRGELKPIWRFFGADEPNYAYMKDGTKLLAELGELSPKSVFFRAHNLLTSGDGTPALKWGSTGAYSEDANGNPVYNWTIVDRIFDAYLQRGVRPYVQIGFMPKEMSVKPEPYQHKWTPRARYEEIYTGWAYPPKDYAKWAELVHQWTKHCIEKYGRQEVETWYWEVWNEANIGYWRGTPQEFRKLHDYAIDAVRRALPTAKVGGPDSAGGGRYLREFLEHCVRGTNYATGKTGTPIDFIAFHAKGAPTYVDGHVRMGIANQLRGIDQNFGIIASFPELKPKPIVIGESDPDGCAACTAQFHPQNGYRNGTLFASYTAAVFARKHDLAEKHGVNLEGALTWAFEFEDQPYFAGFRSLATNGIDKPVINVFRMFAKMGGKRLTVESDGAVPLDTIMRRGVREQADVAALASLDGNKLSVLAWHYHDDDLPGPAADVSLTLTGLPVKAAAARVTHYRIDDAHSNAFSAWKQMGSPQQPTAEPYKKLEAAGKLAALGEAGPARVEDGRATMRLTLPRQAVSLVVLDLGS